ncbi:hypothetical protein [Marivita sp.]|uniref:hypothetical protein n=1 Tax=Marivita sp. TaxID=2003365 RepID=UPI003F6CFDF5
MSVASILMTSVVTGVFCAAFAVVVDLITDALAIWAVMCLAFVSGFAGSLLAQMVLKRKA